MTKTQGYVFVLWANRFDETTAAIFVTELRKAGLRVKLVSLAGQPTPGAYGLSLVPDMTLEEALPLANQAVAVILPCNAQQMKRMQSDPRLVGFMQVTHEANAQIVVNQALVDNSGVAPHLLPPNRLIMYQAGDDILLFVQRLGISLNTLPKVGLGSADFQPSTTS